MADDHSKTNPAPFFGARAAWYLAASLLAALTLSAVLAVFDRSRLQALERFEEVTSAGDTAYFQGAAQMQKPPPAAAVLNGQPLYPVSYKKVKVSDTDMLRVSRDASKGLTIYRSRETLELQDGESARKDEPSYFLKIAPGEYVKVRPSTPGK